MFLRIILIIPIHRYLNEREADVDQVVVKLDNHKIKNKSASGDEPFNCFKSGFLTTVKGSFGDSI